MTNLWTLIKTHVMLVIICALLVVLYVDHVRLTAKANAAQRVLTQASTAAAVATGATQVTPGTTASVEAAVAPALKPFVAALKAADKKNRVESGASSTIQIADVVSPAAISPTGPGNPNFPGSDGSFWKDEYFRYKLDLHTGLLERHQSLKVDMAVARDVTGQYRWVKFDVFELNPVTGEQIPTTGLSVTGKYAFTEDKVAAVPMLYVRPSVGMDHALRPGAGIEFVNGERLSSGLFNRLNGSLLGYYDKKTVDDSRVVLQGGYRFLWNISAGPYVGITFSGKKVYGLGATLRLK